MIRGLFEFAEFLVFNSSICQCNHCIIKLSSRRLPPLFLCLAHLHDAATLPPHRAADDGILQRYRGGLVAAGRGALVPHGRVLRARGGRRATVCLSG